jgi:hypothetical protein
MTELEVRRVAVFVNFEELSAGTEGARAPKVSRGVRVGELRHSLTQQLTLYKNKNLLSSSSCVLFRCVFFVFGAFVVAFVQEKGGMKFSRNVSILAFFLRAADA